MESTSIDSPLMTGYLPAVSAHVATDPRLQAGKFEMPVTVMRFCHKLLSSRFLTLVNLLTFSLSSPCLFYLLIGENYRHALLMVSLMFFSAIWLALSTRTQLPTLSSYTLRRNRPMSRRAMGVQTRYALGSRYSQRKF